MTSEHRGRVIAGVIMGAFLAALDTTILATVMPTIVGDLGGLPLYSWIFSVYMIMTAVSMPIWGKLSDALGKKRLFVGAVGLFLGGSALCGAAQSMVHLIVFRGIQGVGAGGLASIPFALVSTLYPPRERGKALGILASAWGVSSVIGPLLGSVLVTYAHWRWAFFVNIPLGIAAMSTIVRGYKETERPLNEEIDFPGAGLLTVAIVSLLLAVLEFGRARGVPPVEAVVMFAIFVLFLGLFIRRERTAVDPILDLALFNRRAFLVGNILGFLSSFAMYGVIAFVPLFAQSVQGGTAMAAGLVITPMSLTWSAASLTSGRLAHRVGENFLIRLGMVLMVLGFCLLLWTRYDSSMAYLILCVVTVGCGMGCQTPSLMLTVQHSVEQRNVGVATSTQMLARTIGGAVGVSVMGSAIAASMVREFADLRDGGKLAGFPAMAAQSIADPQKLLGAQERAVLSPDQLAIVLTSFTHALHAVFLTGLAVIAAGAALSILLPPSSLHLPHTHGDRSPGA